MTPDQQQQQHHQQQQQQQQQQHQQQHLLHHATNTNLQQSQQGSPQHHHHHHHHHHQPKKQPYSSPASSCGSYEVPETCAILSSPLGNHSVIVPPPYSHNSHHNSQHPLHHCHQQLQMDDTSSSTNYDYQSCGFNDNPTNNSFVTAGTNSGIHHHHHQHHHNHHHESYSPTGNNSAHHHVEHIQHTESPIYTSVIVESQQYSSSDVGNVLHSVHVHSGIVKADAGSETPTANSSTSSSPSVVVTTTSSSILTTVATTSSTSNVAISIPQTVSVPSISSSTSNTSDSSPISPSSLSASAIITSNGQKCETSIDIIGKQTTGFLLHDNKGDGKINNISLHDRQVLSKYTFLAGFSGT